MRVYNLQTKYMQFLLRRRLIIPKSKLVKILQFVGHIWRPAIINVSAFVILSFSHLRLYATHHFQNRTKETISVLSIDTSMCWVSFIITKYMIFAKTKHKKQTVPVARFGINKTTHAQYSVRIIRYYTCINFKQPCAT